MVELQHRVLTRLHARSFQTLKLAHAVGLVSVSLGRTFRNLIQMAAETKDYSNLFENVFKSPKLGKTGDNIRGDNYNEFRTRHSIYRIRIHAADNRICAIYCQRL